MLKDEKPESGALTTYIFILQEAVLFCFYFQFLEALRIRGRILSVPLFNYPLPVVCLSVSDVPYSVPIATAETMHLTVEHMKF